MISFDFDLPEKDMAGADHVARVGRKLVAAFVRKARQDGLTKAELARRLNLDKAMISRMLQGNANLTLRSVGELCWAIGVRPELNLIDDADLGNQAGAATLHVVIASKPAVQKKQSLMVTAQ